MDFNAITALVSTACFGTVCLNCDLLNICGRCYDLIQSRPCTADYSSGCKYYCCQTQGNGGGLCNGGK